MMQQSTGSSQFESYSNCIRIFLQPSTSKLSHVIVYVIYSKH